MESLKRAYAGKRVFVTGHTGFKGSWLCEWLLLLGAEVWGYSLPPPTEPSLFEQLGLAGRIRHRIGDVRDAGQLAQALAEARPDVVVHLAAQPLVREAHARPLETWSTNVLGTVHLLEALRPFSQRCAVVVVTTDKVYEEPAVPRPHSETDALGGAEPYGSSKAAAELAAAAWRASFFGPGSPVAVATARAGNVIGGGDWAKDRLVPDCMRALARSESVRIRRVGAVRPWQHVLEPLGGYLALAAAMGKAQEAGESGRLAELSSSFNFGPTAEGHRTVREVVEEVLKHWPGKWESHPEPAGPPETEFLRLDIARVGRALDWRPRWDFGQALERTTCWYRQQCAGKSAAELTRADIQAYEARA